MPKMTFAEFNGMQISIQEALHQRREAEKLSRFIPVFLCLECKARVIPFKRSKTGTSAHFEHHRDDDYSKCSQKHSK